MDEGSVRPQVKPEQIVTLIKCSPLPYLPRFRHGRDLRAYLPGELIKYFAF